MLLEARKQSRCEDGVLSYDLQPLELEIPLGQMELFKYSQTIFRNTAASTEATETLVKTYEEFKKETFWQEACEIGI